LTRFPSLTLVGLKLMHVGQHSSPSAEKVTCPCRGQACITARLGSLWRCLFFSVNYRRGSRWCRHPSFKWLHL